MNRILLLEDDVSLVDGLVYSLKKNEFDVEVARTVNEAMNYLPAGEPSNLKRKGIRFDKRRVPSALPAGKKCQPRSDKGHYSERTVGRYRKLCG